MTATALSAQALFHYDINQYDKYQPPEVPGWGDDRSLEHTAWNAHQPMKMVLGFEPVSYACYSNFISFQIAEGNVTLYPNTIENTTIYGRKYYTEDETKQINTSTVTVGSPTCRFEIDIQTFEIVGDQWRAKAVQQPNPVEKALAETWKKIRDENISNTEKLNMTTEHKRLEAEMEKGLQDDSDRIKKALTTKGYKADQISRRLNFKISGLSNNTAYFSSNFPASKECFFGSGHIDFSGTNPSLVYVANSPTERTDDNWFETRAGYATSNNAYFFLFSNRRCAVKIQIAKEVKKAGNWIKLPAVR